MKRDYLLAAAMVLFSCGAVGISNIINNAHNEPATVNLDVKNDNSGRTNKDGCHKGTKTGGYHCQ